MTTSGQELYMNRPDIDEGDRLKLIKSLSKEELMTLMDLLTLDHMGRNVYFAICGVYLDNILEKEFNSDDI